MIRFVRHFLQVTSFSILHWNPNVPGGSFAFHIISIAGPVVLPFILSPLPEEPEVTALHYPSPILSLSKTLNDIQKVLVQAKYSTHRQIRNLREKEKLISSTFPGLTLDPILQRLANPSLSPGYIDPRNCIVFRARPPPHILSLSVKIQGKLKGLAPHIWLMPPANMHLTTLEITHSLPPRAIAPLLCILDPAITALVSYPSTHPSRLVKPLLSFDASAVALSFVPADDGKFTYHHLRRSLFEIAKSTGIEIESRYVVPSAHITLCRFIETKEHATEEKMKRWIEELEGINEWLVKNYWAENAPEHLEWIVDELALWVGRVWYGDGEMVAGEGVTWNGVAAIRPGEYRPSQRLQGHHVSGVSSEDAASLRGEVESQPCRTKSRDIAPDTSLSQGIEKT